MKNKILKGITYFTVIALIIAGSGLDSECYTANFICAGCLIWLVLFFLANRKRVMSKW